MKEYFVVLHKVGPVEYLVFNASEAKVIKITSNVILADCQFIAIYNYTTTGEYENEEYHIEKYGIVNFSRFFGGLIERGNAINRVYSAMVVDTKKELLVDKEIEIGEDYFIAYLDDNWEYTNTELYDNLFREVESKYKKNLPGWYLFKNNYSKFNLIKKIRTHKSDIYNHNLLKEVNNYLEILNISYDDLYYKIVNNENLEIVVLNTPVVVIIKEILNSFRFNRQKIDNIRDIQSNQKSIKKQLFNYIKSLDELILNTETSFVESYCQLYEDKTYDRLPDTDLDIFCSVDDDEDDEDIPF